jgi:hypothetical protein
MKNLLLFAVLFVSLNALAGRIFDSKEVSWLSDLKSQKVFFFHVCGSSKILPTQKSLNKDFAFGMENQGFFFTEMPGVGEYQAVIKTLGVEEAKASLRARFEKAHLWRHSQKGLTDLGAPTKIELPFLATVKDCLNGSKNSMGFECKKSEYRTICCSEKFVGPRISWGAKQEYLLMFSPDPSVRLKVPAESTHRYCNFQQINEVAGSGK